MFDYVQQKWENQEFHHIVKINKIKMQNTVFHKLKHSKYLKFAFIIKLKCKNLSWLWT